MSSSGKEWDYRNSVLIVWDVQNGIAKQSFNYKEAIANISILIDSARCAKRPIIFSQQTGLPYELMSKYNIYSQTRRGLDPRVTRMEEGSEEWKFVDEVAPGKNDLVIKKHTPNFFVGTMFELYLRNMGVDTLILSGFRTDAGVESTARYASEIGFLTVIVEDAVGSNDKTMHDYSLAVMRNRVEVRKTSDVAMKLRGS